MTKEEARLKFNEAQNDLKMAEIILEMHENGVREIKEDIAKLEEIINKKDDWRSIRVPDGWHRLYREKIILMADMMHFAHARNEGWIPDWENPSVKKWGLSINNVEGVHLDTYFNYNTFVFGVSVKSKEIAKEMLEEFGERIESIYNKQY